MKKEGGSEWGAVRVDDDDVHDDDRDEEEEEEGRGMSETWCPPPLLLCLRVKVGGTQTGCRRFVCIELSGCCVASD